MHDLSRFGLAATTLIAAKLRKLGTGATSLEDVSQRIARLFYDELVDGDTGRSACVLSRCYKTHRFSGLPRDLRSYAEKLFPDSPPSDATRCLTLLGSYGELDSWKSRKSSQGHQAIPLTNERVVLGLPMVARLTQALGIDAELVVNPNSRLLLEHERKGFNVFHVRDAAGSPYVPAQTNFVESFGVRSVVSFGFVAPPDDIFTTILFTRVTIEAETAELFKTLALSARMAVLPLMMQPVFEEAS
jgi:hypothetical protein